MDISTTINGVTVRITADEPGRVVGLDASAEDGSIVIRTKPPYLAAIPDSDTPRTINITGGHVTINEPAEADANNEAFRQDPHGDKPYVLYTEWAKAMEAQRAEINESIANATPIPPSTGSFKNRPPHDMQHDYPHSCGHVAWNNAHPHKRPKGCHLCIGVEGMACETCKPGPSPVEAMEETSGLPIPPGIDTSSDNETGPAGSFEVSSKCVPGDDIYIPPTRGKPPAPARPPPLVYPVQRNTGPCAPSPAEAMEETNEHPSPASDAMLAVDVTTRNALLREWLAWNASHYHECHCAREQPCLMCRTVVALEEVDK